MEPHVVIGTAGHIDHGKTTLVKALTGVDTDRLAEEKARGITIDIGFAPIDLDGLRASVVDVPGHEAFVRNMLAGATGIDAALLVIAADEGVMPQTREHLAILDYLGVERVVVALTKCDLVDEAWLELVETDLPGGWPVVRVSAATGAGLGALRSALKEAALGAQPRPEGDLFRLPVDRVFAVAGAGTVVTGTVWSGTVRQGDEVVLLPGGDRARVRSIETHGAAASVASPGRRTALNLAGIDKAGIARGSVVVHGEGWRASSAADVLARFSDDAARLRARVHVHHGTAEVVGRIARIGEPEQGTTPLRLMFDQPLVLRAGDRLVMRSWSPVTTIGGAVVTDPWTDQLDRANRKIVATRPLSAAELVARRGARGMSRAELRAAAGPLTLDGLTAQGDWFVAPEQIDIAERALIAQLSRYHASHPLAIGMPAQAWRDTVAGPAQLAELAEARLLLAGAVVREGATVRLPAFVPGSSAEARSGMQQLLSALELADAEPPSVAELARLYPELDVTSSLRHLARDGRVVAVADRYYVTDALDRERLRLVDALRQIGPATPAAIRGRLGRSRKWLIPFLEWADREGVTIRDGDVRKLNLQAGA